MTIGARRLLGKTWRKPRKSKQKRQRPSQKRNERCMYAGVRERRKAFGNDWRTFVVRRKKFE